MILEGRVNSVYIREPGIRNDFSEKWSIKLKPKENICEGWVKHEVRNKK